METPVRIRETNIALTGGFLLTYLDGAAFLLQVPTYEEYIVLTFSSVERLIECARLLKLAQFDVKKITDGTEFLHSIFENDGVMLWHDLHTSENGKERWKQISKVEYLKMFPRN